MRKQDRVKRAPRDDEISVQATYFMVGENIYQAPSVYDIVGNHLVRRSPNHVTQRRQTTDDEAALGNDISKQVYGPGHTTTNLHSSPRIHVLSTRTRKIHVPSTTVDYLPQPRKQHSAASATHPLRIRRTKHTLLFHLRLDSNTSDWFGI